MFGFLAAVGLAIGVAAVLHRSRRPARDRGARRRRPTCPTAQMVAALRFLSLPRAPRPARAGAGRDRRDQRDPAVAQGRRSSASIRSIPNAQDARRLMSIHLPGLIDRYLHVPRRLPQRAGRRRQERRRAAGRRPRRGRAALLDEISRELARADLAALETQGRFIKSRYGEDGPGAARPGARTATEQPSIAD